MITNSIVTFQSGSALYSRARLVSLFYSLRGYLEVKINILFVVTYSHDVMYR